MDAYRWMRGASLVAGLALGVGLTAWASMPTVSNATAEQIEGTKTIRITYDLQASGPCAVSVLISDSPGGCFRSCPRR